MVTTAATTRVDAELVRRGLARSRRHAAELVAAGRVSVSGRVAPKPSAPVGEGDDVVVAQGADPEHEFASRAALKLTGVLDALARISDAPRVADAFCADLGASTGGFTDVLLARGARHVVAVDVGHDQLVPALRSDERVTVVEGFNVRDLTPRDLAQPPDLVVADLSFISLTLVLPALASVLRAGMHGVLLVKPQFEVGRERLGRGGVVRDPALHSAAVTAVVRAGEQVGLRVRAVVPSALPGPSGNREFFVWVERAAQEGPSDPVGDRVLAAAVGEAVAWDPAEAGADAVSGHPPEPPAVVVGQDAEQKELEP